MKKLIKVLILVLVIVLTLIVLAMVFLPKIVPLNKIANMAADKVGTKIDRTISIEKVDFSIFSGIHLKKITLSNEKGYSPQPMIMIKDVTLHYQLLPLILKRKVVIKDVGINGLNLLVELKGKSNNIQALTEKLSDPGSKTPTRAKKPQAKNQNKPFTIDTNGLIDINVARLYFTNSNVKLINHNNESRVFEAKNINFEVTNLNTNLKYSPANIQSSVELLAGGAKTRIDFTGKLLDFTEYDLDLKIDKVAIDKLLSPFIKQNVKQKTNKKNEKAKPSENLEQVPNFDFFKNFKIDFLFTLKEFSYQNLKVTDVQSKVHLKDLLVMMESEAKLYEGLLDLNLEANLKQPNPSYHTVLNVNSIQSEPFLVDFLDIKDFVSGAFSADADISSELSNIAAINGFVNATFTDGQFISAKIMGEIIAQLLKSKEGQGFEKFFVEIKLKKGLPEFGTISMDGNSLNLNLKDLSLKNIETQVKKEVDAVIKAQKQKIQKQVEVKKEELQAEIKKQVEQEVKRQLEKEAKDQLGKEAQKQFKDLFNKSLQ